MIVEYMPNGQIFHLMMDPVPPEVVEMLTEMGKLFVDLPPEPLPDLPALDENGEPIVDVEAKELFDEDGEPLRGEDGEQLVEVIRTPRMITGRTQSAVVSFDKHWVQSGVVVERPTLPVPAQIDLSVDQTHTITGLPVPSLVRFDGQAITLEDGEMTIEGEEPGRFTVQIEAWPFQAAICEVNVNAA